MDTSWPLFLNDYDDFGTWGVDTDFDLHVAHPLAAYTMIDNPLQRYLLQKEKSLFTSSYQSFPQEVCPARDTSHNEVQAPINQTSPMVWGLGSPSPDQLSECSTMSSSFYEHDQLLDFDHYQQVLEQQSPHQTWTDEQTWSGVHISPQPAHVNMKIIKGVADNQETCLDNEIIANDISGYWRPKVIMDTRGHDRRPTIDESEFREDVQISLHNYQPDRIKMEPLDSGDDTALEMVVGYEYTLPIKQSSHPEENLTPAPRPKRKRSTKSESCLPTQKAKPTKFVAHFRSTHICETCNLTSKDVRSLQKHITAVHIRPYACTFSFAGCTSTFGSKNEWKRHVLSQHLALNYWHCKLGSCLDAKTPTTEMSFAAGFSDESKVSYRVGNEFNRKDLFTQHLRRMHAPVSMRKAKKRNVGWEEKVRSLQKSCLVVRRQGPARCECPVQGCDEVWIGPRSWDERMEHVAKYLENGVRVRWEDDSQFLVWALQEGIIGKDAVGRYHLVGCIS